MGKGEEEDRPWTEEQWEKMMRESDLRAARFGELLETLIDHPKRDVLVAREMGWNELADTLERHPHPEGEFEADQFEQDESTEDEIDEDTDLETRQFIEDRKEGLHDIPAYVTCMRVGRAVTDALQPYQKSRNLDEMASELVGQAFIGIHISCAKISGGHAMGYEDDVLCGNIVNNKRALEGARQSIQALEALADRKVVPAEMLGKLLPMLREAEASIEARITELRSKVWWA